MIAIGCEDYIAYGCPKCNCVYGIPRSKDCSYGVLCVECETKFIVLAAGIKKSPFGLGSPPEYPILVTHPNKKKSHKYIRPDKKSLVGEYFKPRGIGV